MKSKGLRDIRQFLFVVSAIAILLIAGCEEPSVSINARLGDFFDDLGDATSNSEHARLVDRHFHPDTESLSQIRTAEFWGNTKFDSPNVSSYSWNRTGDSSSNDFGGTTRVSVRVDPSGPPAFDAHFFMDTSGGDQKIRAIDQDPSDDDVLIKSLPTPLYSP